MILIIFKNGMMLRVIFEVPVIDYLNEKEKYGKIKNEKIFVGSGFKYRSK